MMLCMLSYSDEVRDRGFTMILDMRGTKWETVKPILKALQVGRWSLVAGHWSLVAGHWSPVACHWLFVANILMQTCM